MSTNQKLPTVTIINTSQDYLDSMRLLLNAEGFVVDAMNIADIKMGVIDVKSRIADADPRVILYDIAFPYRDNWAQCQNIMSLDICKGREFILTTPNIDALEKLVGVNVGAHEIIDRELDLKKIVDRIKKLWDENQTAE